MVKIFILAAIWKAMDMVFIIYNVQMAYFMDYGSLQPKSDVDVAGMLRMLKVWCKAMEKGGVNGTVTNGKEKFVITPEMCSGFVYDFTKCGIDKVGVTDGDYVKETGAHIKNMLL